MADNLSGEANGLSESSGCGEDSSNKTQIKKRNSIMNVLRKSIRVGEINNLPLRNSKKEPNSKMEKTHIGNDLGNSFDYQDQFPTSLKEEASVSSEERMAEVWKFYTLPEIPPEPLSVMQISNLIKNNVLDEAYANILSLRREVQCEHEELGEKASQKELLNKEKDLKFLYNHLRDKLAEIVQQSSVQPSCNDQQLVRVAAIILEEEKQKGDTEETRGWRDVWRTAIQRGVKEIIKEIHLDNHEQNASWLSVHLGQVGKVIVEQLKKVKSELTRCYPPNFNVFEIYVSTFQKAVGEHLKGLLEKVTEGKDYYALLDFILKRYPSEKIIGNKSLQPELKEELKTLNLDSHFLDQIKKAYCNRIQADVELSLDNIIKLEQDEMWKDKIEPQIDENLYLSHIHMDILMYIKGPIQASSLLDEKLGEEVMCCCLHELQEFPKRFESAFVQWNKTLDPSLWAEYHITYINSFRDFKEQIESYRQKWPSQVNQLDKEIDGLVNKLSQALIDYFKTDTKPLLKMMMTGKWLNSDEDFQELHKKIESLSKKCKHMSPQHAEEFVSDVHYFVVKEYISQLMKNNYSCKNRKNEKAAAKIGEQWGEICELFQEMNSVQHWLYPVGCHLEKIIGEIKESEIKNHLRPMVEEYPDFSHKHLSAVLYFRGVTRGRQRQIQQMLSNLKQHARNAGTLQHALFNEMEVSEITDCLIKIPFCSPW
ncbi:exocyst complex component 3-like protein 4 isoform X2 [Silurus meridionalis]|uniref:exocyst complex component 3-like protein 4 isoform X2 n=1 Tax=Silurus meridionalis TaxID=175797 RepID=UPI001EEB0DDA|nr:exocyst complex component 3-like protein 4 isoform X2 [Silurus meridionalis]